MDNLTSRIIQLNVRVRNNRSQRDAWKNKYEALLKQYKDLLVEIEEYKLLETMKKEVLDNKHDSVILQKAINSVGVHYSIYDSLFTKTRKREVIVPRHIIRFLLRTTNLPQNKIAELTGCNDHSTIYNSCKFVEEQMYIDKRFNANMVQIIKKFKS